MEEDELKGIVERMVAAGESEDNIKLVIENYKPPAPTAERSAFDKAESYSGQFLRGVSRSAGDATLGLLGAVDEQFNNLYKMVGLGTENYQSPATTLNQSFKKGVENNLYINPEEEGTFGGQVAEGAGSVLPMMVGAGASVVGKGAQALKAAPTAFQTVKGALTSPAAVLGGGMTAVPEYEAAKAAGVPDDQLFGVLAKNYLVGQTEAIPLENLFGRLNKLTGGTIFEKIKKVGVASGIGAFEEATQEGVQNYLSNQIAQGTYDPDRDPMWGVFNSMAVGGVIGAILPGIGGAMSLASPSERSKLAPKIKELQELHQRVQAINDIIADNSVQVSPDAQAIIDTNNQSAGNALVTPAPDPTSSEITEKKIADIQEQLDKDNLDKLNGQQTLSAEERLKLEDQHAILKGKPTEAEKEAEKAANKEGGTDQQKSEDTTTVSTSNEENITEGPSEEYTAADKAYQEELLKTKSSPNVEIGPKGLTILNDDGVKEVKQLTDLWQARDNVRISELKTPKKRAEKSVKMTPAEALKHQVITFYRGVSKGVTKGSEGTKELINKVREAVKTYNLTDSQVGVLLTKIKNTNLFTAGSVSRLNTLIDKVANDSLYADKLNRANDLRGKIKKRRGSEKSSRREKDALKAFTQVDPTMVDVDAYLKQAEGLIGKGTFNIAGVNEYLSTTPDTNAIKTQDRIEATAERLGLTFEEAQHLLEDESPAETAAANKEKEAQLREELQASVRQGQIALTDAWENGEIVADTKHAGEDVEALQRIDPTLLTTQQLKDLVRMLDKVTTNEDWGNVGRFTAISKAQQDFKELQKVSKDFNILNISWGGKQVDSLPLAIQALKGLPEHAALFQLYMGMKGVNDASVRTLDAEEAFVNGMNKLRKQNPSAFAGESVRRQGVYSELIKWREDADPNEALAKNKSLIEDTIQANIEVGEVEEANRVAQAYAPFKDTLTMDDVTRIMEKTDSAGKKVIDYMIDFYAPYGDQVVEHNDRFHDQKTFKVNNYSGPRVWGKTGIDQTEDEFTAINNDNQPSPFSNKRGAPKQGSTFKEFTGEQNKGAILNFNKHKNATNGVRKTVWQLEATMPMLQVRENAGRKELLNILGKKEGDAESTQKAEKLRKNIFDKKDGIYYDFEDHAASRKVPDSVSRMFNAVLSPLRKLGYMYTLSGISQMPKQATVLANVAIQVGDVGNLTSSMGEMYRDFTNGTTHVKEFLKGESVSLRGAQKSEVSLGDLTGPETADAFKEGVDRYVDKGFEGVLGIKPLVATDVAVAQASYIAFYKKYLKKEGVKFEGLAKENDMRGEKVRREARAYAKQMVDVLQVVSNPAELGKLIKSQDAVWQVAKSILIPYGSFSTNTKSRMYADIRAMKNGTPEQRAAAAKDLGATLVEQATFQTVSGALKIYVFANIGSLIAGMFDLPEDKKKGEKNWDTAVKVWQTNIIKDVLPIVLTQPGEQGLVHLINWVSKRFIGYKDPLFEYKGSDNPLLEFADVIGPYGAAIEKLYKLGEVSKEAATGTRSVGEKEKKLTPEQRRFTMLVMGLYGLSLVGKMPADVLNAIDKERRTQKPGRVNPRNQQIEYTK